MIKKLKGIISMMDTEGIIRLPSTKKNAYPNEKMITCTYIHTYLIRQNIQSNIKLFRGSDNPSTAGRWLGGDA